MKLPIFLILFFAFVFNSFAGENQFYFFGGGGEPKGPTTSFDENIPALRNFIKTAGWKTTSLFNGGHFVTENHFRQTYKGFVDNESFTKANITNKLSELKKQILEGREIDQILIGIDSHGSKKSENEKAHSIALANDEGTFPMEDLLEVSKLATARGIRFAIIDNSCFSGNSQALKKENPNLCVITASPSTGVAYGNYVLKNVLNEGFIHENLEASFINAFDKIHSPNYPMISTELNDKISGELDKLLGTYTLRDSRGMGENGPPQLLFRGMMEKEDCVTCFIDTVEKNYSDIQAHVEKVMKVTDKMLVTRQKKLKEFNDSLSEYYMLLQDHLYSYQRYHEQVGQAEKLLNQKMPNFLKQYSIFDLGREGIDREIVKLDGELMKATNAYDKNQLATSLEWIKELNRSRDEALQILPQEFKDTLFELKKTYQKDKLSALSNKVAQKYREYYKQVYTEEMALTKTNPCREFILKPKSKE